MIDYVGKTENVPVSTFLTNGLSRRKYLPSYSLHSHFIVILFYFFTYIVVFLGLFCLREKDAMRLTPYEAPTRETRPDYNTVNYMPHSFR